MVSMKRMVHDGTRCSYRDAFSLCVRGECKVSVMGPAEWWEVLQGHRGHRPGCPLLGVIGQPC